MVIIGLLFLYLCVLSIVEWRDDAAKEWGFKR